MKQNLVTFFIGLFVALVLSVAEGFVLPSPIHAVSCSFSDNATNTLNSACVVDGTTFVESGTTSFNGITNGDMVVSGADVTVSPGVTMTWSPGKAIIIQNGGRIIRGSNAVLKQVDPQAWFRQQLGFDAFAAGAAVKVLGNNLHVCNGDPCTVVAPSAAGNLVVESSIKFADGTTQTTAASGGVPATGVMFFNAAACPSGWTELTSARGMYIVGLPSGGTLAGTSGTALTNLESRVVGQHGHTYSGTTDAGGSHTHSISDPGHTHTTLSGPPYCCVTSGWGVAGSNGSIGYGFVSASSATGVSITSGGSHSHTYSGTSANSGSVAGTNAPYIQLLACQKS